MISPDDLGRPASGDPPGADPIWGAVIVAAGRGERLGGDVPKALVDVGGRPLVAHAVGALREAGAAVLVVVHPPGDDGAVVRAAGPGVLAAAGGATRSASVRAGLRALPDDIEIVAVHDAARGLCPPDVIRRTVAAVRGQVLGAAPGVAAVDTLKRVDRDNRVLETVDRSVIRAVQTPQVARRRALEHALQIVERDPTDELGALERARASGEMTGDLLLVEGSPLASKATYPHDLPMLDALARAR